MSVTLPNAAATLATGTILSLLCGVALAEPPAGSPGKDGAVEKAQTEKARAPVDFKLRLQHPFSTLTMIGTGGLDDTVLFGGSFGVDIKQLVTLELGGEIYFFRTAIMNVGNDTTSYRLFVRGGVMPTVIDNRGSREVGSTLQLGGLLGYAFLELKSDNHDDSHWLLRHRLHSFSLGAAIDYTYWAASNFGVCFRLLVDFSLPFHQTHDNIYGELGPGDFDVPWIFGLSFTFGFAF